MIDRHPFALAILLALILSAGMSAAVLTVGVYAVAGALAVGAIIGFALEHLIGEARR